MTSFPTRPFFSFLTRVNLNVLIALICASFANLPTQAYHA